MKRAILMLMIAGAMIVPVVQAQVKHIEMRVEGMT
jgi:hypothetical protein